MATGSRTLKLSILGDVDNLNKSLKTAGKDVDTFGDKMGKVGKAVGAAFAAAAAAAAAYAVKIGIDGVKAAIEDEKAQTQLALALKNATGATQGQIKATEDAILQMSLATGVADDDLRPALQRLAISTGSVGKAQELLSTALDISAATGKPVETVAIALSKAYDGNSAALAKLGVGLSSAELKTMSFEQVQGRLTDLFGGAAAANADTYSGRIARMQVAFNEAKETIGYALLPILEKLMQFINQIAAPALKLINDGFGGSSGLGAQINSVAKVLKDIFVPVWDGLVSAFKRVQDAIKGNKDNFEAFYDVIKWIAPLLGKTLGLALQGVGMAAEKVIGVISAVLGALKPLINFAIDGINAVIKGLNLVKFGKDIPLIPKIGATAPTAGFSGTMPSGAQLPTGGGSGGSSTTTSGGGVVVTPIPSGGGGVAAAATSGAAAAASTANVVSNFNAGSFRAGEAESLAAYERAQEKSRIDAIIAAVEAKVASAPVTVNMGVVGDPEAAARAIVDVLNRSSGRGALGAGALIL